MTTNWNGEPEKSKYCCVKEEYLVRGKLIDAWNDRGSGAKYDVQLWEVVKRNGESGTQGGNFISTNTYDQMPTSDVYLLKHDNEKVQDVWTQNAEIKPIEVYQDTQVDEIWTDRGSGADKDVAIYSAKNRAGYYIPSHFVVGSYSKPSFAYMLRATDKDSDIFTSPTGYNPIWNDRGSGADRDVQIYEPSCPDGYAYLGQVAIASYSSQPGNDNEVSCVKREYIDELGREKWIKIWQDRGSGANKDVTLYEARSSNSNYADLKGMGAVASWSQTPYEPWFLKKEFVSYKYEKPIKSIEVVGDIRYDFDKREILGAGPQSTIQSIDGSLVNYGSLPSEMIAEIRIMKSYESTFIFNHAYSISVEKQFGLPTVAQTTVSVSVTASFEHGTTQLTEEEANCNSKLYVPAR